MSAVFSKPTRVLHSLSGPQVNKQREVRGNWMQLSVSHCVLITQLEQWRQEMTLKRATLHLFKNTVPVCVS